VKSKPKIFTDEVLASIPAMIAGGMKRDAIAEKLGTTVASLQVKCSIAGVSLRPPGPRCQRSRAELDALAEQRRIKKALLAGLPLEVAPPPPPKEFKSRGVNYKIKVAMDTEALALLVMRAEKLGTTVDVVARKVLEAVARDNLYDAVVDEAA